MAQRARLVQLGLVGQSRPEVGDLLLEADHSAVEVRRGPG
jgi:hypothetical protein